MCVFYRPPRCRLQEFGQVSVRGLGGRRCRIGVRFLRIALPSLALRGIEDWTFSVQGFVAGFISTTAQATNAIMPNITDVQYALGSSISCAGSTVIGHLLGEGNVIGARQAGRLIMMLSAVVLFCQVMLFFLLWKTLPPLFTSDAVIIQSLVKLYPLTLAFSYVDGHQAALTGILIGAGRQSIGARLIFVCYWVIGLPLGVALAFGAVGQTAWGLEGLWTGMLVAVICHVVSFGVYVSRIDWDMLAAEVLERTQRERVDKDELTTHFLFEEGGEHG